MAQKCDDDVLADIIEMLLQDDVENEDNLKEISVTPEQMAVSLPE